MTVERGRKKIIATANIEFYGDDFQPKIHPPTLISDPTIISFHGKFAPYGYSIPYDY